MCPSNIACFDFREPVDDQLIQKLYREWIEVAPNFFGDYYPLTEYSGSNNDWIAWQFDRPEEGTGMVQAFRRTESPFFGGRFRLRGLDPDAEYKIVNMDADERETRTGKDLMDQGLEIVLEESPGSAVIEYWKK
ncbi:MAG: GH36 C-terminal domain-containing protein [Candidatus Omnitrophica bacterium]|nr:GH36 C-terminal domain-containing protein [Candidatus Omnitrophota bacterium]